MPRKKIRKVRLYTRLGGRIAALGDRQRALAKVLRVSQQTISKKLRGETAILVTDLEKLARHYKVHMTYFFEDWRP
ncbi:MAG: helix-turn-helix domain-containing protein [Planctomycetota bacterium]|jgi:transcriptional regulator with XRE-family HTH domain